ncbi:MAG TPA: GDSL-type esterase/lipase family protein [Thermoanaerobaculia bacterium]|nr:GDSL-type esterase/lipase family protein [Thermoanaerobaculia bacterium]
MARSLSRLWLWRLPAAIAVLAALLFAGGFVLALRGSLGEPIGEPPALPASKPARVKPPGRRILLVLGDSLARGTGDETGRGYASDVLESVRKGGAADMANLAVDGAESGDVARVLESENVGRLAASADWILLSVGGNDLSHAVSRETGTAASALDAISAARSRYAGNLRRILSRLREVNPLSPIYVLGLYDPFTQEVSLTRVGSSVILGWNNLIEETALSFPQVFVVPTFDLFYGRADRLGADHFHPNARGHEAIAQRIVQLLPPPT